MDSSLMQKNESNEEKNLTFLMLERYERCPFCNSRLIFSHEIDLVFFEVVESSRCTGCGVTLTPKKYKIH